MQYGYFDNDRREYVINRVDTPASWTNYIGVNDYCAVLNQTAGGYSFYKSPQYHRVTRFRPNGVPLDRPGHYVYIRDDETGEYWSVSWQPVGKPLDEAVQRAKEYISGALADLLDLGQGSGPMNHAFALRGGFAE